MTVLNVCIAVSILLGLAGCLSGLRAWFAISKERARLSQVENLLIPHEAWNDGKTYDKNQFSSWLNNKSIKPDSHIGDFVRTCWSAWLAGRPSSLSELHVLVARRERSRLDARLSAGIAALLLVVGIVGTLSSIHPILKAFRFQVSANGELQEVAGSTDMVNNLINSLGDAFYPSMAALIGTVLVVSIRGLYLLELHRFTLELDRFAVDSLIPQYRTLSMTEQYREVKDSLGEIAKNIQSREQGFENAIGKLEVIASEISPTLDSLKRAMNFSEQAATKLSSSSESVSNSLIQNLGQESPLFRAISGFGSVFQSAESSLNKLTTLVQELSQSSSENRQDIEASTKQLGESIVMIVETQKLFQINANKNLEEFKRNLETIPELILETGGKVINSSLEEFQAEMRESQQKQSALDSEASKQMSTVANELAIELVQVKKAVSEIKGIEKEISIVIKKHAQEAIIQIQKIKDISETRILELAVDLNGFHEEIVKIGDIKADILTSIQMQYAEEIGKIEEIQNAAQSKLSELTAQRDEYGDAVLEIKNFRDEIYHEIEGRTREGMTQIEMICITSERKILKAVNEIEKSKNGNWFKKLFSSRRKS